MSQKKFADGKCLIHLNDSSDVQQGNKPLKIGLIISLQRLVTIIHLLKIKFSKDE
jgi:hypothetical protein